MNISRERWSKFKQELAPIIYLSTIQIWWNFNCPAFIRLGAPSSTIVGVSLSIVSIIAYVYLFTFADAYAPLFNLENFDDAPEALGSKLKYIQKIGIMAIVHIGIFFAWYNNIYGMSNIYYIFSYAHCSIAFLLMARATNRPKNIDCMNT